MKIVATSDTHFPFRPDQIPEGDVFLHAGDLMYSGYEREWYERLESLAALPHKTKILVPGNHDIHIERYAGPVVQELRQAGVEILGLRPERMTTMLENGMTVLGLPYVTNLPLWAFNQTEQQVEDIIEGCRRADIVVSHSPPRGILDGGRGNSYGIGAYRRYLSRFQPSLWFCGHIHESYGVQQVERTTVYNVAMCDENYEQIQQPVVIEV